MLVPVSDSLGCEVGRHVHGPLLLSILFQHLICAVEPSQAELLRMHAWSVSPQLTQLKTLVICWVNTRTRPLEALGRVGGQTLVVFIK
jgi:hypothetical protein